MKTIVLRVITVLCWAGLTPLLILCALRILHLEHLRIVIVVETLMFYLLIPAYTVLIFGISSKQGFLSICACFVVICHLFWFVPELGGKRSLSKAEKASGIALSLYSQNVMYDNQTPEQIAQQIKSANTDLVMLEEFSERDYQKMSRAGAFDNYSHTLTDTSYGPAGLGFFSKYSLTSKEIVDSPGFPQMRAEITIGDKSIVVWNVHMQAPVDSPITNWLGDLSQLKTRLHQELQPTLVAGDFNATWGHRPFRNLLTNGYHEAAVDLGRGDSRTWPANSPLGKRLGGYVRFDHVLYNQNLRATSQYEVSGAGSDHRGVVTHLLLLKH